jgi:hypothetical protein
MGLDMWLMKTKGGTPEEVHYWRKANQIREYFVSYHPELLAENIEQLPVNLEMLTDLEQRIERCLGRLDEAVSSQLLPTSSGFFFGSLEYDNYYYEELDATLDAIKKAKEALNDGYYVFYHEWW